jgi:hypothetical protein
MLQKYTFWNNEEGLFCLADLFFSAAIILLILIQKKLLRPFVIGFLRAIFCSQAVLEILYRRRNHALCRFSTPLCPAYMPLYFAQW